MSKSEPVAHAFVFFLRGPPGSSWFDLACGLRSGRTCGKYTSKFLIFGAHLNAWRAKRKLVTCEACRQVVDSTVQDRAKHDALIRDWQKWESTR